MNNDVINGNDTLVSGINLIKDSDIPVRFEVVTLLFDKPDLLSLYIQFLFLAQVGLLLSTKQDELARACGLSLPTFNTRRDELRNFGLIDIEKQGKAYSIFLMPVDRLLKTRFPKEREKRFAYLKKLQEKIVVISPSYIEKQVELHKEREAQMALSAIVREEVKKVEEKKKAKVKSEERRFPNEDYEMVLNNYKKLKGVGLIGPEINRAKKAIKQMFLAERKPKEIIDCMAFFKRYHRNENYKWMANWTLETVMKKMPEFLGGSLRLPEMGDDIPEV